MHKSLLQCTLPVRMAAVGGGRWSRAGQAVPPPVLVLAPQDGMPAWHASSQRARLSAPPSTGDRRKCSIPGLTTTRGGLLKVAQGLAAAKPQLVDVRTQPQFVAQSWALVRTVCPPAAPAYSSPQALVAWIYYVVAGGSGDVLFGKSWSGEALSLTLWPGLAAKQPGRFRLAGPLAQRAPRGSGTAS